jgi:hypothetical protein
MARNEAETLPKVVVQQQAPEEAEAENDTDRI